MHHLIGIIRDETTSVKGNNYLFEECWVAYNMTKEKLGPLSDSHTAIATYQFANRLPEMDLAFEQNLLERGQPAIFTYIWSTPVLVLGNGQSLCEVNTEVCQQENIPILRRRSGGTGVLHDHTLNVGLILPKAHPWTQNVRHFYRRLLEPVGDALMQHRISVDHGPTKAGQRDGRTPICFETHGDDSLLIDGKKVFGCAQRRCRLATLVHGSLFLRMDSTLQGCVFNVTSDHIQTIMSAVPNIVSSTDLADTIIDKVKATLMVQHQTKNVENGDCPQRNALRLANT